jgi:hypothetical protein
MILQRGAIARRSLAASEDSLGGSMPTRLVLD